MSREDDKWWSRVETRAREGSAHVHRQIRPLLERAAEAPLEVRIATGAIVFLVLLVTGLLIWTPSVSHLDRDSFNRATIVYSADGDVVTRYFDENRTSIELEDVSPAVIEALLATEDRRFYKHSGIDLIRTVGAVFKTLSGDTQGGSTITMQLARNAFPEFKEHPMLVRKLKEWVTAFRIELAHSKDDILELYLNTVPFLYQAYGIEAAALTYFDKPARDLEVLEAATLIGMLKGPSSYNPVLQPKRSQDRRNVVLANMAEEGYLSQARLKELQNRPTPLNFRPTTPESGIAPYFAEHVRRQLDSWAEKNGYNAYTDGLRVYTTLDAGLQREAATAFDRTLGELQAVVDVEWSQRSVPYHSQRLDSYAEVRDRGRPFEYFWNTHPDALDRLIRQSERYAAFVKANVEDEEAIARLRDDTAFADSLKVAASVLQGGFVAIDPGNGHVKVWIGGRDFSKNKFDHVAQARRQPGSTFKPFVYAAALAHGYTPDDALPDWQFQYFNRGTGQTWSPGNFGGTSGSMFSLRQALAYSKNTITVQLVMRLGSARVVEFARRMGIRSPLDAVPSIGLGTSGVSLLELTAAYSTIASLGEYREPVTILRIENQDGKVIEEFSSAARQAISEPVAYGVLDMMRGVVDQGTGRRIRSQYGGRGELAGKTGTTQDAADGWFMLLHPDLVMGSWVGFDAQELTFRTTWWGQGAHTALHVPGRFLDQVDLPARTFQRPDGLGKGKTLTALLRESREGDTPRRLIPEPADPGWSVAGLGDDEWTGPLPGQPGFSETAWLNYRERRTSPVKSYLEQLRQ